jgi:hypothetical protein
METSFAPIEMPRSTREAAINYKRFTRPPLRTRMVEQVLATVRG